MEKPSFSSYMNYSSDNYGVHSLVFRQGGHSFYFSYDTLIAFTSPDGLVIRENEWAQTTGKHLNAIDPDKSKRVDGETFWQLYEKYHGGK